MLDLSKGVCIHGVVAMVRPHVLEGDYSSARLLGLRRRGGGLRGIYTHNIYIYIYTHIYHVYTYVFVYIYIYIYMYSCILIITATTTTTNNNNSNDDNN